MSTNIPGGLPPELEQALHEVPRFVAQAKPGDYVVAVITGQPRHVEIMRVFVRFQEAALSQAGQEGRRLLTWAQFVEALCDPAGNVADPSAVLLVVGQTVWLRDAGGVAVEHRVEGLVGAELCWVIRSGDLAQPRTVRADAFIEPLRQTNILMYQVMNGLRPDMANAQPQAIDEHAVQQAEAAFAASPPGGPTALDSLVAALQPTVVQTAVPAAVPAVPPVQVAAPAVAVHTAAVMHQLHRPPAAVPAAPTPQELLDRAVRMSRLAVMGLLTAASVAAMVLATYVPGGDFLVYTLGALGLVCGLATVIMALPLSGAATALAVLASCFLLAFLLLYKQIEPRSKERRDAGAAEQRPATQPTPTPVPATVPQPTAAPVPQPAATAVPAPLPQAIPPTATPIAVPHEVMPTPPPLPGPLAGANPATQPDRGFTPKRVIQLAKSDPDRKLPSDAALDRLVATLQNDLLDMQEDNGLWEKDYNYKNHSRGDTDMAMWALVASGVSLQDPRMKKALKAYLEQTPPTGTYRLGFRLNTWSHLARWADPSVRDKFKAVLNREVIAMVKGMSKSGQYGYQVPTMQEAPGLELGAWTEKNDNSNTQYAVYGVWAAAEANVELNPAYWPREFTYWMNAQSRDGGWGYKERDRARSTMTDAGMNSLYVIVDKWLSRRSLGGYRFLQGFAYQPEALAKLDEAFKAISAGWAWIEKSGGQAEGGHIGYSYFGMQRLGLASGRKYIGGRNWAEQVVGWAATGDAGDGERDKRGKKRRGNVAELSWRLMCLAFGRAPVMFNKLAWGGDERNWNYYFRDVANLTQWISYQTERHHNWQIVSIKDSLHDLCDAPILIMTGSGGIDFDKEDRAKIRRFCELGGTVIIHPNQADPVFPKSAERLFGEIFKDEGYEFAEIPKTHQIYVGRFAKLAGAAGAVAAPPLTTRVPLRGMSDGGRYFAIIIGGDIAGAWQMFSTQTEKACFQIMLNLRMYAAPNFSELPSRFRSPSAGQAVGAPANPKVLSLVRIRHEGHSNANSVVYDVLSPWLAQAGVKLNAATQVVPSAETLAGAQVIHITGNNRFTLPPEQIAALHDAIKRGAYLLIDPAYGKPAFLESAKQLVVQLGLEVQPVDLRTHPLFRSLTSLKFNADTIWKLGPRFDELLLGGKVVGLLSEVDMTASAVGQQVTGYPALTPDASRDVWANVMAMVADAAK